MTDDSSGLRELLAIPDFRRLWFAQIVSDVGDSLALMTLLFLVQRLTGSTVALAGVAIAIAVPSLLFGLVSGVFVDRWDRRTVMIVSELLRGVVVLGLVVVNSADLVWLVYVIAFTQAAIGTLFDPAKSALLPELVGEHRLLAANSVFQTSEIIFGLAGTAIAGVLAASLADLWPAFVIDALTFSVSAFFVSRIATRPATRQGRVSDEEQKARSVWGDLMEGFRVIGDSRPLIGVVTSAAIAMLGLGAVNVLMIPFLIDDLQVPESWFGLIGASQVAGMVVAGVVVAVLGAKFRPGALIAGGMVVVGSMIAVVATVSAVWQLMIILTVVGLAVVPIQTAAGTLVQTLVPAELRGRVGASMETAASAANVVSLGFAGVMAAAIGVRNVYVLAGAITIVAGAAAWVALRDYRSPPSPATDTRHPEILRNSDT